MRETMDAVLIHPEDTVAVALRDLEHTARVRTDAGVLTVSLADPIPMGHKLAMRAIAAGEVVRKYGEPIGVASQPIPTGGHVHTSNLASQRGGRAQVRA